MTTEEPQEKKESELTQALKALMKVLEYPLKPHPVANDAGLGY
ncbi:MAG: hypothetical protein NWF07_01285 [Candidatus Bathyarchaeota archaeon]|nr:hypothetical protein [Candidatus Bathyarchaeota archaeon]